MSDQPADLSPDDTDTAATDSTVAEVVDVAAICVVADTDVDEGIARVYAAFNDLDFSRHPAHDKADHFVLIGRAGQYADEYGTCTVIQGETRVETVEYVVEELRGGYRSTVLDYEGD